MNRLALQGPWVVSPRVEVVEIRHEEAIEALGTGRLRRPHLGFEEFRAQMDKHLAEELTAEERKVALEMRAFYARFAARGWMHEGDLKAARSALARGRGGPFSLKRAALALALTPGLGSLRRLLYD